MHIISIEGNIGSGKSTLLEYLRTYFKDNTNIVFINEPVNEWMEMKDDDGKNIIEKYYANQEKYAFSFQVFAYITKLKLTMETYKQNPNAIFISERSLYTDRYVFAQMLYDSGKIDNINYKIYLSWFDYFIKEINASYSVIYVNTDTTICYERINNRNRSGEDLIPLEYLKSCDCYHKTMLDEHLDSYKFISQYVFDGNITRTYTCDDKVHLKNDIEPLIAFILCPLSNLH